MARKGRRKTRARPRAAPFVFLAALALLATAAFGIRYARQMQDGAAASALPPLSGFVMDRASLIDREARMAMEAELRALDAEGRMQMVVATLYTTGDRPIAETAITLARGWGIGHAGRDDGVLLLLSERERQARIEVGYGLEGVLTDAAARIIIAESIAPALGEGDFTAAARRGMDAVLALVHPDPLPKPAAPGPLYEFGQTAGILFFMLVIAIVGLGAVQMVVLAVPGAAARIERSRRFGWFARVQIIGFSRRRDREDSSSGGSMGGGGSFGGGGANG